MKTDWQNRGKYLVASVDCQGGPGQLDSGGVGWYEVEEPEWICNWKLRLQVSITRPKLGSQFPFPAESPVRNRPEARKFDPDNDSFLDVIVEDEIVEIWFPIPDCIQRQRKSFGASGGTTIVLADGPYRCQAQLIAKPPSFAAELQRVGRTLEFLEARDGHANVIGTVENWMPQSDPAALLRAVLGGESDAPA